MTKRMMVMLTIVIAATLTLAVSCGKKHEDDSHSKNGGHDEHSEHGAGHAGEAEGHAHDKAALHGGQVTMSIEKEFHFEVLFQRDTVKVYLYNGDQLPISAKGVTGTVKLSSKDRSRKPISTVFAYFKSEEEGEHGQGHKEEHGDQDFLQATIDSSKIQEGDAKADFSIKNLPGNKEKTVDFRETFQLTRFVEYACPMGDTEPTDEPGKCKKCAMDLKRVTYIYGCPMHPKVTSRSITDACWICKTKLKKAVDHQ